jgi:hypothetical protein
MKAFPMKNHAPAAILLTALLAFGAGCARHEGAYAPVHKAGADLENQAKFVLLDQGTRDSVTVTGLQERILEDGRLEVVSNVRNRLNRRIEVQINCVFKDARGFPIQDDVPFRTLILTENAQEGVRFVSAIPGADTYTIRVRQAR